MVSSRSTAFAILAASILLSCAPALDRAYLDAGSREVSFAALRQDPALYQGRLFIFGGVIVRAKFTEAGTQIEAMHVPVEGSGEFADSGRSEGRFLAVMPKGEMLLDPVIYTKGRRITLAGEFTGTRSGRIDEMDYVYPLFRIRQIHLWPHTKRYDRPPHLYDPWLYPYPYYYRSRWWYYPQKHAPVPVHPPVQPQPKHAPRKERDQGHERDREER